MTDTPTTPTATPTPITGNTTPNKATPIKGGDANQIILLDNGRTVQLNAPVDKGQEAVVLAKGVEKVVANFDADKAEISMKDGNLVFTFENGSQTVIEQFELADPMPQIVLQDGTIVAGDVVVAQLEADGVEALDLETAAGGARSGGGSTYSDDLGDVIGMLQANGPLGFSDLDEGNLLDEEFEGLDLAGPINLGPLAGNSANAVTEVPTGTNNIIAGNVNVNFRGDTGVINAGNPNQVTVGGSLAGGALTSGGEPITIALNGNTYTGTTPNGTVIFTMTINPDGSYTFTILGPLDHADPNNPSDVISITFPFTATDSDGDSASGVIRIDVIDVGPTALPSTVVVDETAGLGTAMVGDLHINFGADGAGRIEANGSFSSSIPLTSHGEPIVVTYNAATGTYTGTIAGVAGDTIAFTLTINPDGTYSFVQFVPLDHPNTNDPNDALTFTFGVTGVDNDGDTVVAPITVTILDDGPTVTAPNVFVVDETVNLGTTVVGDLNVRFGVDGVGSIEGNGTFSSSVTLTSGGQPITVSYDAATNTYVGTLPGGAVAFTLVLNADGTYGFTQLLPLDHPNTNDPNDAINLTFGIVSTDGDGDGVSTPITIVVRDDGPTALANGVVIDETVNLGQAMVGDVNFDFGNDGRGSVEANGTFSSSVTLTSGGQPITVAYDAATGTYTGTLPGGAVAFTLVMNADGTYSFTLLQPLDHPNTNDPNDAINLSFGVTGTDGDGDSVNGNISITIRDDGPTAQATGVVIDETSNLGQAMVGDVNFNFGADGRGSVEANGTFSSSVTLTSHGQPITVAYDAATGTYTGTLPGGAVAFTLVMNANGTYSFTQFLPIDHPNTNDPNDAINLNFGVTGTDGDGDSTNGNITVTIRDDGPTALASGTLIREATDLGRAFVGDINVDFGADGRGALAITGTFASSTPLASHGNPLIVTFDPATNTYTAMTTNPAGAEQVAFTLTINADGTYRFVQFLPLDHANPNNPSDTLNLSFGYSATDGDGDAIGGNIVITVQDSGPTAAAAGVVVDETSNLGQAFVGDINVNFGVDGVGNIEGSGFSSSAGGVLMSHGQPVTVSYNSLTNTYTGTVPGGAVAFVLVLAQDGTYSFTQFLPLNHPNASNPNDPLNLNFAFTATDGDGDSVGGTIVVTVRDDGPTAVNDVLNVEVNGNTLNKGNLLENDHFGADGAGINNNPGVGINPVNTQGALLSVTFDGVVHNVPHNGYIVVNGTYGYLTVAADGSYVYSLYNTGPAPTTVVQDVFTYTMVDGDGDTSSATFTVNIDPDSIPTIDPNGPGSSGVRVSDETTDIGVALNGQMNINYGADGQGATGGVDGTGVFSSTGGALTSQGSPVTVAYNAATGTYVGTNEKGAIVFTLTLNDNGSYTFTLVRPLDHFVDGSSSAAHNDPIFLNFGVQITDVDGDVGIGSLQIRVNDDGPVANNDIATLTQNSVTGNVTLNDALGADGFGGVATVTFNGQTYTLPATGNISIPGQYGTLVINSSGNYTYTVNSNAPFTPVQEGFSYTVRDGDGDTSSANLTINIDRDSIPTIDPNGPGSSGVLVIDETTNLNQAFIGDMSINYGGDGRGVTGGIDGTGVFTNTGGALTSNGVAVVVTYNAATNTYTGMAGGQTVFTLILTDSGAYSFRLVRPLDHFVDGSSAASHNDPIYLNFGVQITDGDGDVGTGSLQIRVNDDGPTAVNDFTTLAPNANSTTGNVLTNDSFGNDGSAGLVSVTVNGQAYNVPATGSINIPGLYGVLTINAQGQYTYTMNGNAPFNGVQDVFTYTIRDRDGDTASANLAVTIDRDSIPTIDPNGPGSSGIRVSDETTDIGSTINGQMNINYGGDGQGTGGIDGTGAFTNSGGALTSGGVAVVVTYNAATNTYTGTAGGATVFTLVLNDNGSYSFRLLRPLDHFVDGSTPAAHDDAINLNFGVQITDADGDVANGTLQIRVDDDGPVANNDVNMVGDANQAVTGNVMANDVAGADGATVTHVTFNGTTYNVPASGNLTITGQYGVLVINAQGQYSYDAFSNSNTLVQDVFRYTLTDRDGDTAQANLTISIDNDGTPTIDPNGPGSSGVRVSDETTDIGQTINGQMAINYGDDGQGATGGIDGTGLFTNTGGPLTSMGVAITVTYNPATNTYTGMAGSFTAFTLTLNDNGSYSFRLLRPLDHPVDGSSAAAHDDPIYLNFGVQISDADGDVASSNLQIRVEDDGPRATADSGNAVSGVPGGFSPPPPPHMQTVPATGNVLSNDNAGADGGATVLSINGTALNPTGTTTIVGQYGTLVISPNGSYTYTPLPNQTGTHTENFSYTMRDGDGDTASSSLSINITNWQDNSPPSFAGSACVILDETYDLHETHGGTINFSYGAAGQGANGGVFLTGNFTFGGQVPTSNGYPIRLQPADGTYPNYKTYYGIVDAPNNPHPQFGHVPVFKITVNDNGTYTYEQYVGLDHNIPGSSHNEQLQLSVGIRIIDANGNQTTGSLCLRINDDGVLATNDTAVVANGQRFVEGSLLDNDMVGADHAQPLGYGSNGYLQHTDSYIRAVNGIQLNFVDILTPIVIQGQYGRLEIIFGGVYKYYPTPGTHGALTEVFTYTLQDFDGDTSNATLTISIATGTTPASATLVDASAHVDPANELAVLLPEDEQVDHYELAIDATAKMAFADINHHVIDILPQPEFALAVEPNDEMAVLKPELAIDVAKPVEYSYEAGDVIDLSELIDVADLTEGTKALQSFVNYDPNEGVLKIDSTGMGHFDTAEATRLDIAGFDGGKIKLVIADMIVDTEFK